MTFYKAEGHYMELLGDNWAPCLQEINMLDSVTFMQDAAQPYSFFRPPCYSPFQQKKIAFMRLENMLYGDYYVEHRYSERSDTCFRPLVLYTR